MPLLHILAGVAVLACVIVMIVAPVNNNDIWLQLRIGQLIVDTGDIPRTLLFPFGPVADNEFHAHEWLASVFVHLFERQFGLDALIWMQAGLGLVQFALAALLASGSAEIPFSACCWDCSRWSSPTTATSCARKCTASSFCWRSC
jgi:hypothetical protein